jgi:hypothetical protein
MPDHDLHARLADREAVMAWRDVKYLLGPNSTSVPSLNRTPSRLETTTPTWRAWHTTAHLGLCTRPAPPRLSDEEVDGEVAEPDQARRML